MKEGRLQLWLYMFGVQNIGTAGILIDIVKESKKMREITKSDTHHTLTKYLDLNDSKSTHHYGLKMSMTFL